MSEKDDELQPIIVKKIVKGGGHHGGAWKVAYADFVTAMMAFFLLLWLLNVTTSEQKEGIADYFDPNPRIAETKSGAGGIMGGLTVTPEGAMTSTQSPLMTVSPQQAVNPSLRPVQTEQQRKVEAIKQQMRTSEQRKFSQAQRELEEAIEADPELKALANNIMIDKTPEGLRIQVLDQDGESMFARGSAQMYEKTRKLMTKIAQIVMSLPNEISIRGHTDGVPYGQGATYTNWELSADRANSSRRVLLEAGIPTERLNNVVGKADREHFITEDPADAKNRRISIVLLKEELTNPDLYKDLEEEYGAPAEGSPAGQDAQESGSGTGTPIPEETEAPLYEETPGAVEFP